MPTVNLISKQTIKQFTVYDPMASCTLVKTFSRATTNVASP